MEIGDDEFLVAVERAFEELFRVMERVQKRLHVQRCQLDVLFDEIQAALDPSQAAKERIRVRHFDAMPEDELLRAFAEWMEVNARLFHEKYGDDWRKRLEVNAMRVYGPNWKCTLLKNAVRRRRRTTD